LSSWIFPWIAWWFSIVMWLFTSGYIWKKYPKIVFWWFQMDNHEEILWISGGSMVVYWYTLLTSPDASCMTKPGCLRQKESMIPFFWELLGHPQSTVSLQIVEVLKTLTPVLSSWPSSHIPWT
jgi:hypothetical protein